MLSSSIRSILEEIITNLLPESTAPPHHPPTDARNLKIIIFHYRGRQKNLCAQYQLAFYVATMRDQKLW